jgi:hypothetical protein
VGSAGDHANADSDTYADANPDSNAGLPCMERERGLYRRHVRDL